MNYLHIIEFVLKKYKYNKIIIYCYNTNFKYNSKIYLCKQIEVVSKKEYKLLFGNA